MLLRLVVLAAIGAAGWYGLNHTWDLADWHRFRWALLLPSVYLVGMFMLGWE